MASGGGAGDGVRKASEWWAASSLVAKIVTPAVLAALVRLNIFEALAAAGDDARLTAAELAAEKPLNAALLSRLLRLMACENVLTEEVVTTAGDVSEERRFGLTPLGKLFVENPHGSMAAMLHWSQHPICLRAWDHLHEFLADDSITPFARATGGLNPWEYGMRDQEFANNFNKAMEGTSRMYMRAILDAYTSGFDDVNLLVDVGGGNGTSLQFITDRYPHIRGVNFDLLHVVAACPEIPRVEHVPGDFRESVPAVGDTIFMKMILHDWDDATCVRILKNCFEALPEHGKVIVIDAMLPESGVSGPGDSLAIRLDVGMMSSFGSNARERTEMEFRKVVLEAGWQRMDVICKVDHLTIMELHKA